MTNFSSNVRLEAAREYTARGWVVHPLYNHSATRTLSGKPIPDKSRGKQPVLKEWQKRPLATDAELIEWFEEKDYNIGLQCGQRSNVTVLDFDSLLFLEDVFNGLCVDQLSTLVSVRTAGRCHVYFKYAKDLPSEKHPLLGIEVLSDGSNCVLPPSIHRSGEVYRWVSPSSTLMEIVCE